MTELSLRLNALEGQGRAETNGSQRAGALFLGCPPVSVGQEVCVSVVSVCDIVCAGVSL